MKVKLEPVSKFNGVPAAGRAVGKYASYHGEAHCTCLERIEVDRAIAQFSSKNQLVTFSKAYDKRELDFGGTGLRISRQVFDISASAEPMFRKSFRRISSPTKNRRLTED